MTEIETNAVINELVVQRNSFGDRCLQLAAQLVVAQARIAELEKDKANVVEMPTRPAA